MFSGTVARMFGLVRLMYLKKDFGDFCRQDYIIRYFSNPVTAGTSSAQRSKGGNIEPAMCSVPRGKQNI